MNVGIFSRLETPLLFPACGVNGVEIAVPAAYEESASGDCGRSVDHVAGMELPPDATRGRVKGVDIPVAAAEIDGSLPDPGGREVTVERIGHRFGSRQRAMNMPGGKAAFARILKAPL